MITSTSDTAWLKVPLQGFLTSGQEAQLDAIFLRILPGDPTRHIPNAIKARASRFVSLLLARDVEVYVEIPTWRTLYPKAIDALQQYAQAQFQSDLAALKDEQMNKILAGLESGSLKGLPADVDQKLVFKTFLRHCYQGCFGDPRWGGNDGKIMWRALGYLQPAEDGLA
jgi:hypothetical protein